MPIWASKLADADERDSTIPTWPLAKLRNSATLIAAASTAAAARTGITVARPCQVFLDPEGAKSLVQTTLPFVTVQTQSNSRNVLLLGSRVFSSDRLTLPHPEVRSRRFVLVPLLELDPGLRLPDGSRLSDVLADLGEGVGQSVSLVGEPLL